MDDASREGNSLSRRDLLKRGAVLGLGAAALGVLYKTRDKWMPETSPQGPPHFPEPPPAAPESAVAKEPLQEVPTEFGFNTHMFVNPAENDNQTLEAFKQNVDQIAGMGQKWIRFNFSEWEILSPSDTSGIHWADTVTQYDEAVDYAKDAGLNIFFVATPPSFARDYAFDEYKTVVNEYYGTLAERYRGKIDVWQICNEPDIHNFQTYGVNLHQLLDEDYIDQLTEVIKIASSAIKTVDPEAKTTANLDNWIGHRTDLMKKGSYFYDRLGDAIDLITLDLYPENNIGEIERLPEYVSYFEKRYNKPVFIGELGLSTYGQFSEYDQAAYLSMAIDALKDGRTQPRAILIYKLTDSVTQEDNVFNHFGLQGPDGTPKKAFQPVVDRMQIDEEEVTPEKKIAA
ncbi:MAG: cellulase family glycosylhydrolase [Candidatus Levybacteria bacterium]|nr:cellulase family glycosylhydrolase [Candidatus Levybacteria bacterium]